MNINNSIFTNGCINELMMSKIKKPSVKLGFLSYIAIKLNYPITAVRVLFAEHHPL
jgi:hypothetical protein